MVEDEAGVALGELAELTGSRLIGRPELRISQVAALDNASPGTIAFLGNPRYRRFLTTTSASAVIMDSRENTDGAGQGHAYLINDNPYLAFSRIARRLNPVPTPIAHVAASATVAEGARLGVAVHVSPGACIEDGATVGDRVHIGSNTVVGQGCRIGNDSQLMANVTLYPDVVIGARVIIHSGSVIGADGFGFANSDGVWEKVPQLGRVLIGDDVEIGANTCVDRGAIDDTVLEDGVKIDNLVQIGHNVEIGAHTAIAANAGISGSTTIGPGCMIGGGAGMAGHLSIAGGSVFTGMAMVTRDVREAGMYSSGTPITPTKEWRRNAIRFRQLDSMATRLRELERRLDALELDTQEKQ